MDGNFQIYDPNFPGTFVSDQMRTIPFSYTDGFNETYVSGKTRADNLVFNIFYHAASKLAATPDDYSGLYQSAENEFQGSSTFPAVTLTDVNTTPAGTTPTDTDSDGVRDTAEAKTTITGTITGGQDTINSTLIFVDNVKYTAPVVNGEFSKEVPLLTGDNDVVILATDENTFSNWAGFLRTPFDARQAQHLNSDAYMGSRPKRRRLTRTGARNRRTPHLLHNMGSGRKQPLPRHRQHPWIRT